MPQLRISNQVLNLDEQEKTYFDADEASAQTELSANGTNFSVGQYVLLGQLGTEKSEIIKLHASTAPTSTTLTTATATVFAHNRGDIITYIPYNQIVVERSTDAGTTWTPLSAVNIRPDSIETIIDRPTDASTDVYRCRFYDGTNYSDYSDQVVATGYADNTVWAIKHRALDDLGEKTSDLISDDFLNQSLWTARRELDDEPLRFSFRTKFNQDIGDIIPGRWSVAVPSDLRDKNSNINILSLRVGADNIPLEYQDTNEFNENYRNVAHSTLNGAILAGATSLTLTSSGDFDEDGDIYIAAEDITLTNDSVAYTANAESTGVLSGVTGALAHATGRDVWQNMSFGLPTAYTVNDGYIYFDVPFDDDYAGENIKADYYSELVAYDSDADVLDEPATDLFVNYLKAKIKYKKSNGTIDITKDSDYLLWLQGKKRLLDGEYLGQTLQLIPD
jgi:hypothetical protein